MAQEGLVQGSHSSSGDLMLEPASEELRSLSLADLLARAEAVGIRLVAEGDQLRIRGPRNAETLGRQLLERKPEVMAAICGGSRAARSCSRRGHSNESANSPDWDAERAAAVIVAVDSRIDIALLARGIVRNSARQNVLANERGIVRRLAGECDPHLWAWPQALEGLLARWQEWDSGRAS